MTYKKLLTLLFILVNQIVSYAQFSQKEYDEYVDYVNVRYYFKYVDDKIKNKSLSISTYKDDFKSMINILKLI